MSTSKSQDFPRKGVHSFDFLPRSSVQFSMSFFGAQKSFLQMLTNKVSCSLFGHNAYNLVEGFQLRQHRKIATMIEILGLLFRIDSKFISSCCCFLEHGEVMAPGFADTFPISKRWGTRVRFTENHSDLRALSCFMCVSLYEVVVRSYWMVDHLSATNPLVFWTRNVC